MDQHGMTIENEYAKEVRMDKSASTVGKAAGNRVESILMPARVNPHYVRYHFPFSPAVFPKRQAAKRAWRTDCEDYLAFQRLV